MNVIELGVILGASIAAGLASAMRCRRYPGIRIAPGTAQWLAILIILAWAALVGTLAVLKHLAFNSGAYDLGIFDQTIWNSAHGRLFENSVMADSPLFLGHHFSPILLALAPLYWIHPSPVTLLAAQALVLGLAGLPIFWMARDFLRSSGLALAVLVAYLLNPATAYVALFDFHEIALVVPLLALALYLLLRQRYGWFALVLLMSFLVKEDVGLVGAAIGVFIALAQRRRLMGFGLCVLSIAWTLLLVRYVVPGFHPDGKYYFAGLYTNLGSTPIEVLSNFLADPLSILGRLAAPNMLRYLQQLVAPLGGLPLLGWPILIAALPPYLSISLSDKLPSDLIQYQYSASILPVLLTATILGLRWLRQRAGLRYPALGPGLVAFVIAASIVGAYLNGPLPLARHFEAQQYRASPRLEVARQLMAQIPPQASVIAQANLVPHLTHRRVVQVFNFADPALRPDFYFIDTNKDASRFPIQQYDDWQYFNSVARVKTDPEYRVAADREGYLLLEREPQSGGDFDGAQPIGLRFGEGITLEAYRLASDLVSPGETLTVTLYWRAERKVDADYTLFAHLIDAGGRLWGQHDAPPTSEYLPTSQWEPGRLLRADWHVPVDEQAPAGEYHLLIGLYDLTTMQRLEATGSDARPLGNSIDLLAIHVDEQ